MRLHLHPLTQHTRVSGLEAPDQTGHFWARGASPAPVAPARPHGETTGAARQGRRCRARHGRGVGDTYRDGVVLEQEEEEEQVVEDDDDVPVTVDDADDDDQVDGPRGRSVHCKHTGKWGQQVQKFRVALVSTGFESRNRATPYDPARK